MKVLTTEKARHLVMRMQSGALPDALVGTLRDEAVTCGWIRASGVLSDVELRAYSTDGPGLAPSRRLAGPVQVVSCEGTVGLWAGDVSLGLRATVARETDRGLETIAGEIVAARIVALEVWVVALDDLAVPRSLDKRAGVWILGEEVADKAAGEPGLERSAPRHEAPAAKAAAWDAAISASQPTRSPAPAQGSGAAMPSPPRPSRPEGADADVPTPEAGDFVEHFAFGPCDVLKSDGERLHLKVHKDSRVREIALEMLRVIPLEPIDGRRTYRLQRKL